LIGRFRAILDEAPGRMSVGELFDGTVHTAAELTTDHHLVFDWELLRATWTAGALNSAIATREAAFGAGRWPTAVLSNHDQPRHASRLADNVGAQDRDAVARATAIILLTLRGTPFLYYGEELGLSDADIPRDESVDPPATRIAPDFLWWDRSGCRTPMPWAPGPGAGFTTGRPWLRLGPDADTRNVLAQAADPDSILSFYRSLIALRAVTPALQVGALQPQSDPLGDIVAYTRETGRQVILVLVNPGRVDAPWQLRGAPDGMGWRALIGTRRPSTAGQVFPGGSTIVLEPDEGLVLEAVR
jgi:alpha-glucosidase